MFERDDFLDAEFKRAAEQVHPTDRIAEIRERVAQHGESPGQSLAHLGRARTRRSTWLAVGAVAATVAAATTLTPRLFGEHPAPGPTATAPASATAVFRDPAIPVYYAASADMTPPGADGTRATPLAREFHRDDNSDRMQAALRELSSTPEDPDYRTWVPADMVVGARVTGGGIEVELDSTSRAERPASLTRGQASTAGLQVVYTVRAVIGEGRLPITFTVGSTTVSSVLGVPAATLSGTTDAVALAPVNLTTPTEGARLGDTLVLSGRGTHLGPGSTYRVLTAAGEEELHGSIAVANPSARGFQEFETRVDISALPAGDYVVSVTSSGGQAAALPDTKQFSIR